MCFLPSTLFIIFTFIWENGVLVYFYLYKHHQIMGTPLTKTHSSYAFWEGSGDLGRGSVSGFWCQNKGEECG